MKIWGITDTGLVRDENQDAYSTVRAGAYDVAVVCDGMGGTSGGQIASTIAVETMIRELSTALSQPDVTDEQIKQMILYSVFRANTAIRKKASEDADCEKMGTTLVCAICTDRQAVIGNIGDSRAYYIDDEGIRQITRDHSVVENMVERGEITAAEARHHPSRNLITRALGPDEHPAADCFSLPWKKGSFLLLCTDGLVNTLSDQEILFEVLYEKNRDDCLTRLLAASKHRGAPDNVTAVLLMNE